MIINSPVTNCSADLACINDMVFLLVQINSSDQSLLNAFREINQMSDRLNLPRMIVVGSILICDFYFCNVTGRCIFTGFPNTAITYLQSH